MGEFSKKTRRPKLQRKIGGEGLPLAPKSCRFAPAFSATPSYGGTYLKYAPVTPLRLCNPNATLQAFSLEILRAKCYHAFYDEKKSCDKNFT